MKFEEYFPVIRKLSKEQQKEVIARTFHDVI